MSTAIPIAFPNSQNLSIRVRRGIPHFELDDAPYFVTFRLADSLPRELVLSLIEERRQLEQLAERTLGPGDRLRLNAVFGSRLDRHLDRGYGAAALRDPRLASLVAKSLMHYEGTRYQMYAWCVMPNHVHVVLRVFRGRDLPRIVHSWKSFTANEANRILGRSGRFWQREYYDRIARDGRELDSYVRYTIENPRRAGLVDWPYVWPDA